jgi:hypothetical protein
MQCSSMIMGLSRWWLKLFFYLLDVGTGNTLVLYNEQLKVHSKGQEYTRLNVSEFKMKLVDDLVGKLLTDLFGNSCPDEEMEHTCARTADSCCERPEQGTCVLYVVFRCVLWGVGR